MRSILHSLSRNKWLELQPDFHLGRFSNLDLIEFNQQFIYLIYLVTGTLHLSPSKTVGESQLYIYLPTTEPPSNTEPIDLIIFQLPLTSFTGTIINQIDLNNPIYMNKWIAGYGNQPISFTNFSLAHVVFKNQKEFSSILLPGEVYHKHQTGTEYYLVLKGTNTVKVETESVQAQAFELIEVATGSCHHWTQSDFPQQGFNFRYPSIDGDKILCEKENTV